MELLFFSLGFAFNDKSVCISHDYSGSDSQRLSMNNTIWTFFATYYIPITQQFITFFASGSTSIR